MHDVVLFMLSMVLVTVSFAMIMMILFVVDRMVFSGTFGDMIARAFSKLTKST